MANAKCIAKQLESNQVDSEIVRQVMTDDDIIQVITRMDMLLEPDVQYRVLDACACCTKTSKSRDKQCKEFGKNMAGKPLAEKVSRLGECEFGQATLNADHTITVSFYWDVEGKRTCSCGSIDVPIAASKMLLKNKKLAVDPRVMPLSYCYCCAGHFRYHLQNALKIKLKTQEIVSSPINSKGEKPCEFVFDIMN